MSPPSVPPLTLYRLNDTCSMAPHALLLHLGVPFRSVPMRHRTVRHGAPCDLEAADGSLSHEDFLKLNPDGHVPVLVVGDGPDAEVVTECPAVLTYIAALFPGRGLLGEGQAGEDASTSALRRARVAEWLAWLSGTLHETGFAAHWRPARFSDDPAAHPSISRRGRDTMTACYARIEERLLRGKGNFAVGAALTVVDFHLYFFRKHGHTGGIDMSRYPSYDALVRRVESLDGMRRCLEVEGLSPIFGET